MNGGAKRILVADDEQGLRDLFHFILEPLGFEVVSVVDGEAAVAECRRRPFHLVILDVHMPRLSGPDALAQIVEVRPEQRVVVVSGTCDASQVFEDGYLESRGIRFLQKPVTVDELVASVSAALETAP